MPMMRPTVAIKALCDAAAASQVPPTSAVVSVLVSHERLVDLVREAARTWPADTCEVGCVCVRHAMDLVLSEL